MTLEQPDLDQVRRNMDKVLAVGDQVGSWTTKAELRHTGVSVHFTFENEVDMHTAGQFLTIIEEGPGMLVNALRLLLGEPQQVTPDAG